MPEPGGFVVDVTNLVQKRFRCFGSDFEKHLVNTIKYYAHSKLFLEDVSSVDTDCFGPFLLL